MKYFNQWSLAVIPGLGTIIPFFLPSLETVTKVIIMLGVSAGYFSITTFVIYRKYRSAVSENNRISTQLSDKNKEIDELRLSTGENINELNNKIESILEKYKSFVHKRIVFRTHGLVQIRKISRENYAEIRNKYRGQKNESLVAEAKAVKDSIQGIIQTEEEKFDEQLFEIQSYQDN